MTAVQRVSAMFVTIPGGIGIIPDGAGMDSSGDRRHADGLYRTIPPDATSGTVTTAGNWLDLSEADCTVSARTAPAGTQTCVLSSSPDLAESTSTLSERVSATPVGNKCPR